MCCDVCCTLPAMLRNVRERKVEGGRLKRKKDNMKKKKNACLVSMRDLAMAVASDVGLHDCQPFSLAIHNL